MICNVTFTTHNVKKITWREMGMWFYFKSIRRTKQITCSYLYFKSLNFEHFAAAVFKINSNIVNKRDVVVHSV